MAMVREVIERTVINPNEQDIRAIRHEALERIMKSGSKESTVEIFIEIDKKANIVRAITMGAKGMKDE